MSQPKTVQEYIANEGPIQKAALKRMRTIVRKAAPKATEKLAWGMPTLYLEGNLVHFAAFKNHLSLFPGTEAIRQFESRLKKYLTSKGTLQFTYDKPLPEALIQSIVRFCVKQNLKPATRVKERVSRPVRDRHPMPPFVRQALLKFSVLEAYRARPPYQRNDYIGWIGNAAREETKMKRLTQMIRELKLGDRYMDMPWRSKKTKLS